jgi:hypothetical protein
MSGEAPFVTHLTELRRRIIVVAVSLGVGAGVAYAFVDPLADALLRLAPELTFITLSPPELFLAYVRISVIVGIIATLPVTLSQLWLFLRPALTTREKRLFVLAIATGTVFFFGGAAFAYFIIVPTVLRFFVQFSTQTIQASYSCSRAARARGPHHAAGRGLAAHARGTHVRALRALHRRFQYHAEALTCAGRCVGPRSRGGAEEASLVRDAGRGAADSAKAIVGAETGGCAP